MLNVSWYSGTSTVVHCNNSCIVLVGNLQILMSARLILISHGHQLSEVKWSVSRPRDLHYRRYAYLLCLLINILVYFSFYACSIHASLLLTGITLMRQCVTD